MRRIIILLFLILLIPSCEKNEVFSRTELRMDTLCTISVYTRKDEALLDQAFEIIDSASAMIDMYDSESEISRVNSMASAEPVAVSDELFSLAPTLAVDSRFKLSRLKIELVILAVKFDLPKLPPGQRALLCHLFSSIL